MNLIKLISLSALASVTCTHAQTPTNASTGYTPTWQARHHLQWLSDNAGLALTTSHWPLPAAAVLQALDTLPSQIDASMSTQEATVRARSFVQNELTVAGTKSRVQLHVRTASEGLVGYGDNYTIGSSLVLQSAQGRIQFGDVSVAGRLGAKAEASPNAMQTNFSGMGTEGQYQLRPEGSEAVLAWGGWNAQVFSRQNWWGPGWQSSLVNGHNSPSWMGAGLQRGSASPSSHAWLQWMGPWNLDVFVAKAQDPIVAQNQPSGYLFSGLRLTLKPQSWLEVGFSRGLQTAGAGRPSGADVFMISFLGQQVNKEPNSNFQDSSSQIAGYDVRARCPKSWGGCAMYTQWMGEDAAGKYPPLPYKFMKLFGVEQTFDEGRQRAFVEYTNTFTNLFESNTVGLGYVNGVYTQGYTQGARWVGSSQGGGGEVTTVGWMNVDTQRMLKVHMGRVGTSLGTNNPQIANAPHGRVWGISAAQSFKWQNATWTPELAYTHLAQGEDQRAAKRNNVRVGLMVNTPF